ncbi:hypothetical protein [Actinomadura rubrisoli]|uniref:Toxin-antitoxin system HicB family antitoxin n=1 Tax=Actinomadura rubrisoli TaxID=2530368 RepID=A0A4V2YVL2_9ACTN|nr:hypothetical protein [Actinomadura rubrisoli]TDD82047.1 hypothetical protein E1298_23265 [Actinomadura rubrisoli]
MDLTPYVAELQRELAASVEAAGEGGHAVAGRLAATLESAARLVLLNALSDAMAEISSELAPGSVEVRLRRLDPEFTVTAPPHEPFDEVHRDGETGRPAAPSPLVVDADDGGAARTSLRLPVPLKVRAERAARREGLSLNAWLVRAVARELETEDAEPRHEDRPPPRTRGSGKSMTGWVR